MFAVLGFSHTPASATDRSRRAEMRICESPIRIRSTNTRGGCWIDVELQQIGQLRTPCDGRDGPAEAVFASRRFRGRVSDGRLALRLTTEFPFGDGCRWESEQTIRGNVSAPELTFRYDEHPAEGQSGCASACSADGTVTRVTGVTLHPR